MKANIKLISEKTGFSPATVSNALNHKKGVNKDTADKILETARELGYFRDNGISKIKFVMYRRNGQILDDTPFFSLIIDGFQRACSENGYEMVMVNLDRFGPSYEEDVRELLNDISSAVVLLGTELTEEDDKIFRDAKCPFLMLDYITADMRFNGVAINNVDSARLATRYLIDMGHEKIGYLSGRFRIRAFRLRGQGYRHELQKNGITYEEKYRVTLATTMDGAYADMKEYLARKPELPTAFFADNDIIALGAMRAMKEAGIKIPDEVSIVGFDDLPYCEICSPRLTSLRVPKQEMGMIAVKRIIEMMRDKADVKLKIEVGTDFINRDSVKRLK